MNKNYNMGSSSSNTKKKGDNKKKVTISNKNPNIKKEDKENNNLKKKKDIKSKYVGIWKSQNWEKAKKILKKKYTVADYSELFNINKALKTKTINNFERLKNQISKEAIFDFILPLIQSIALTSEEIKKDIFLLTNNNNEKIELTQFECASILSTFFLNMFGNETEGRNIKELENGNYKIYDFPELSFLYYLMGNGILYEKFLFMIRYFIKIGIRMASQNKLSKVEHCNFISSKEDILNKVKDYKDKLNEIYNFDKELNNDFDCQRNSILKIHLNEFDPYIYNKNLNENQFEKNEMNNELNNEIKLFLKSKLKPNEYKMVKKIKEEVFIKNNEKINKELIEKVKIHLLSMMEEKESIIVNFANKYLGGGCMNRGSVQEEILLLICPEILVARAFVKKMNNIQSISMSGFEQFSDYTGYGGSLKFKGDYHDNRIYENNTFKSLMIAVDALPIFQLKCDQFNFIVSFREFIKFITGLQGNADLKLNSCSTGKWGCGVFGGNVYIKFLIQFLACLFADIEFQFSCYHDEENKIAFEKFIESFKNIITEKNVTKGIVFKAFCDMKVKKEKEILNDYLGTLKQLI